jgi:RNA polymerase sigma-70 factor (ECF subfamily)
LIQITIDKAKSRLRDDHEYLHRSSDEPHATNEDEYCPRDFTEWREIPLQALERKQLRKTLEQVLASLPQECREVFTMRDIAHLSIEETAQVLGLTLENVKTRLLRARLQMREALAPGFGGSWSEAHLVSKGQSLIERVESVGQ